MLKILVLLLTCFFILSEVDAQLDVDKVNWIKQHAIPLEGIEAGHMSDASMESLDSLFRNRRIVFLSEQTHYDGSTKNAQVAFVKYLHEHHGFNFLLLERGFVGTHQANFDIQNELDSVTGVFSWLLGNYGSFNHVSEQKLGRMIQNTVSSGRPIHIGGIDIYETSVYVNSFDSLVGDWLSRLPKEDRETAIARARKFLGKNNRIVADVYYERDSRLKYVRLSDHHEKMESVVADVMRVNVKANDADSIAYGNFLIQGLRSRYAQAVFEMGHRVRVREKMAFNPKSRMRDSIMAENLSYYLDNLPEEKFVVLVSSFHASKKQPTFSGRHKSDDTRPLAAYIDERYPGEVYSLGAIRYAGALGENGDDRRTYEKIKPARKGSIEELIHRTGISACVIDFSSPNIQGSWLNDEHVMTHREYASRKDNWTEVFDGVLYIDMMKPEVLRGYYHIRNPRQPY